MKQIYYVIRTLLRGHGSNVIKILSLALGLTMSILLFARVAFEQSFDKCFKDYDNLYHFWQEAPDDNISCLPDLLLYQIWNQSLHKSRSR